jgi:BlaI family transcriptional regulator, penicillinase repressor
MNKKPAISDAEWEVMKILWAKVPVTAEEVVGALKSKTTWKPKTILTLINRLVKKGLLGYEKKGRAYHYFPKINETACVHAESSSFLQRVYDGAFKPMLVNFLRDARLSKEDIEELKRILNEKESK